MIRTLRESKAKLSELVERASRGGDTLISVRGSVKARLTRATSRSQAPNRAAWARQLQALQNAYSHGKTKISVEQILAQSREDRV